MIKKWYSCDGGSISVKIGDSFVKFLNSVGDGLFKCYHMTSEEFYSYQKEHEEFGMKYNYVTFANFNNALVLNDDCIDTIERFENYKEDGEYVDPVAFELNGRYEVLECAGKFYFINKD